MIEPTKEDIGRRVIYTGNYGGPLEDGIITSFNATTVFVCYGPAGSTSKGTNRSDLVWPSSDNRAWAKEHSGQTAPTGDIPVLVALGDISKRLTDLDTAIMTIASILVMMLPEGKVESSQEMRKIVEAVDAAIKAKK